MAQQDELTANTHHDYALLASALVLVSLGLTMVFISSTVMANAEYQDPYFFVKRQTIYALLGVGVLVLGRSIDYHLYKRYVYWLLFISLISLILVLIPGVGSRVRGAARWIRLGPFGVRQADRGYFSGLFFGS